ncbi:hypothetical protein B9G69_002120 [Bdellovibrio sp. SKB1291214]|uniref:hypothetical protein n=1 Tax=Bdellovibrio sp. SKB1291214 TaxID=1732569 RepID=UPI000B5195FA|nr:hypothetical protein [Bdellovibrio sp. SKB1291214]UYL09367.1 hypothetical protein B9G69_002120 [Bdellovibrio sp. SKB1291214]
MNSDIQEFLDFLKNEDDLDYGDFKREVDLHLMRLIENMRPLSREQQLRLARVREELLWMYNDDIEEMRALLTSEVSRLDPERDQRGDASFQL